MTARADYGSGGGTVRGGVVAGVDTGSPAQRAGLRAGDVIATVDGSPLRDVLDWQWHTADALAVTVGVSRGWSGNEVALRRDDGVGWGVGFEQAIFDRVRTCRNDCEFCFMSQLPDGMRPALSLRDDDYRLSFLQGNFVTLTNLTDGDVDRIVAQSLSPLYVSVHAVSPGVRARLIGGRADRALERIDDLTSAGIQLHTQIVLVPGVNDGPELDATLRWLAERDGVVSLGVVPLGYTRHQERFDSSYEEPGSARVVLEQLAPWQAAFRDRDALTWVYAADEFYLNARVPVPSHEAYDGFPQYENGIGIVRSFLDDVEALSERFRDVCQGGERVTVVTGELAAPVLRGALDAVDLRAATVLAVPNKGFGGDVSVAGLLFGSDVVDSLRSAPQDAVYLVPDVIANADGLTLDDIPVTELGARTRRDVRLVSSDAAGLLAGVQSAAAARTRPEEA